MATGLAGDGHVAVATSVRNASRPGAGNVSLVVGGGDAVGERRRLLAGIGLELDRGIAMEQVHGGDVVRVGERDAGRGMTDHGEAVAGVDALVTSATDVALLVMTADCVPVLLAARETGVAAVHAGRRGLVAGVIPAAVAALEAGPAGVEAVIGPAIRGCCYEVPAAMAEEVTAAHPEARATTTWGTAALDLPRAIRAQLREAGVSAIVDISDCTRCGPDRWFSHRAHPGDGRQAAVIARRTRRLPPGPGARSCAAAPAPSTAGGTRRAPARPGSDAAGIDAADVDGAPAGEAATPFLHWRP